MHTFAITYDVNGTKADTSSLSKKQITDIPWISYQQFRKDQKIHKLCSPPFTSCSYLNHALQHQVMIAAYCTYVLLMTESEEGKLLMT